MNDAISFASEGLEELYLFGDWREVVQTARVRGHLASAASAATAAASAAAAAAAAADHEGGHAAAFARCPPSLHHMEQ